MEIEKIYQIKNLYKRILNAEKICIELYPHWKQFMKISYNLDIPDSFKQFYDLLQKNKNKFAMKSLDTKLQHLEKLCFLFEEANNTIYETIFTNLNSRYILENLKKRIEFLKFYLENELL
ncbi:hypothetical protein ACH5RX_002603 [Enterococcus faecalis]|nr:hypothetical protein [Enterococcus faecalis]ELT8948105.1 hypothetical protein [Enterococcus faecalis]